MKTSCNKRIIATYCIFAFFFSVIAARIIYLQVFKSSFFQSLAENQHYRLLRIEGPRGTIFDRRGRVLATDIHCYSIFADPSAVSNPELTAELLAKNLGISREVLLSRLRKKKRFVWIKRKISLAERQKLESLHLEGIGFLRERKRFYPQDAVAASVIGITDIDGKGLEGLELRYNEYLNGKDGWVKVLQDSSSREIILSSQIVTPQRGVDVVVSLDAQLQYWAEVILEETIKDFGARNGSLVIMDASNGEILTLANYPSFNPNQLDKLSPANMRNRVISDIFEPGSVFKVVTLLAAVAENTFSDVDTIFCEKGAFKIPGTVLHDWKPYGQLTFEEVFMKSSNIGVAKIVASMGPEVFFRYVQRLQFGKATGIDLPGEVKGSVKSPRQWSKTSAYIIPIGQEIGVNFLQLLRTFAVVANGGYLVEPHLVRSICSQGFCKAISSKRKRIFPSSVTERVKRILIKVVEVGTGKRAGIKGRLIGGKTGTAQKYDPAIKKYSSSKYRATFVGFVADLTPPLVIGITIDEPRKSHFGGVVAAPAFRKIAQKVIAYIEASERPKLAEAR